MPGLWLPACMFLSAIVHVVLLTAVAVPRQRVTHGETMTVDIVTPDEVPDAARAAPAGARRHRWAGAAIPRRSTSRVPDAAAPPDRTARSAPQQPQRHAIGATAATATPPQPAAIPAAVSTTGAAAHNRRSRQQSAARNASPAVRSHRAGDPRRTGGAAFGDAEFAGPGLRRRHGRRSRHQGEADGR